MASRRRPAVGTPLAATAAIPLCRVQRDAKSALLRALKPLTRTKRLRRTRLHWCDLRRRESFRKLPVKRRIVADLLRDPVAVAASDATTYAVRRPFPAAGKACWPVASLAVLRAALP